MVSALWKACSENNVEKVHELLAGASSADIEIKDHNGATPLIEAVKNGHVEIVKALLNRGADPHSASSEGPPQQLTSDPAILELLNASQNAPPKPDSQMPAQQQQEPAYGHVDPNVQYWAPPPPNMYGYYPAMHAGPPPPPGPDGAISYYPPPLPHQLPAEFLNMAPGNLPPPDVARMIPCRYYPACRYGASCMFAHPQQSPAPYYPGAPPVPQHSPYPPYDPMSPPAFSPGYYAVSPPSFHPGQPNGAPGAHVSPSGQPDSHSPGAPMAQGHPTLEMMSSPPSQSPYSPPGPPPPAAYAQPPQMSPTYPTMPAPQPAAAPMPHPQPSPAEAYPAPAGMPIPAPAPPFVVQPPPQQMPTPVEHGAGPPVKPPTAQAQPDGYASAPSPREGGMGHQRRGSARRTSFGTSRKPPCIFFPSGRCRNGDECRFPHVMPDGAGAPHFGGRGGHRARFPSSHGPHGGDMATIEEKFGNLAVDSSRQNGADVNGRPRPPYSARGANGFAGARADHNKRTGAPAPPSMKQRLPRADEFPVLAGSAVPSPGRSPPLNGGPTAAQVLQAPAPAKPFRDTTVSVVDGNGHAHVNGDGEPDSPSTSNDRDSSRAPSVNGMNGTSTPAKLPVSFAAVANGVVNGVETPNQVSVSA